MNAKKKKKKKKDSSAYCFLKSDCRPSEQLNEPPNGYKP